VDPGNVALYEIALDAHTSMVAVLTTRSVLAGAEFVLPGDHPSVDYPNPNGRTATALLAYPRLEPFEVALPPKEGAWVLCRRSKLAQRVGSLVSVPKHRKKLVDRLRILLPEINFDRYEAKYLAPASLLDADESEVGPMRTRSPSCSPYGYEPRLANWGDAFRRCLANSSMPYVASAEDFTTGWAAFDWWDVSRLVWADGRTSGWPGVRLQRAWHYAGGVTRAIDRLIRKRYPMVSCTERYGCSV
jgi:hypothetical protein